MRRALAVILAAVLCLFSGCLYSKKQPQREASVAGAPSAGSPDNAVPAPGKMSLQTYLIMPAALSAPTEQAVDRKVIRNAELTLELSAPEEGRRKIETIAESSGGFVISSEASSRGDGVQTVITIVMRIPAPRFAAALEDIRKLGFKIRREKITGQDVTEEYIDLEARLKAKRAVEAQFLEIMKQAKRVVDALEVQKALGDVRSDIEQIEGRRRFLENQVTLSTFTITLQMPSPLMSTTGSGLFQGVKQAFGEGFDAAMEVVLWVIRFALVLIPIVILVVLPGAFLWRRLRRRGHLHAGAEQGAAGAEVPRGEKD
jgi:hypothetical protein